MDKKKKKALEAAGWTIGDARDFLDLSDEEAAYVEMKLALAAGVRERRRQHGMTQTQLAALVGSSQSRVAKLEAADASVSLDLIVRTLMSLGATRGEVARLMGRRRKTAAV